jgi:AraC family transcriptional regulator
VAGSDSLRWYLDVLVATLDERVRGDELAQRAYLSRFHFGRLVRGGTGESPGAMRRRLLLERAAWRLLDSSTSVTAAALEAGYEAHGAFTRAFARAFGGPPSRWRRHASGYRLQAPNEVHFHPPAALLLTSVSGKEKTMDLIDRLVVHDLCYLNGSSRAGGRAAGAELDRPLELADAAAGVAEPTLRRLLHRLVFTKEMWTAAITGSQFEESSDLSVEGMRRRLEAVGARFRDLVGDLRARARWDDAFVDTTCEPPQTFTFGGAIAHVITFSAYRRELVIAALARAGVTGLGFGDPMEWERAQAEG